MYAYSPSINRCFRATDAPGLANSANVLSKTGLIAFGPRGAPSRPKNTAPAFSKFRFWNIHMKLTNIGLLPGRLSFHSSHTISHSFDLPAKTLTIQQPYGNGCPCYTAKVAASETGC